MENPINYWYQKYISLKAEMDKMMKEAVEIEVWNYSSCADLRALPLWGIEKFDNLKDGDKVRIIIVKEN